MAAYDEFKILLTTHELTHGNLKFKKYFLAQLYNATWQSIFFGSNNDTWDLGYEP
jgi:hypothetical protein